MKRTLFVAVSIFAFSWFAGDIQAFDDVVRCRVSMSDPVVQAVHPSAAATGHAQALNRGSAHYYYPGQRRAYVPRASSSYRYSTPRFQSNWRGREVDWSRVESRADDVMSAIWSIF